MMSVVKRSSMQALYAEVPSSSSGRTNLENELLLIGHNQYVYLVQLGHSLSVLGSAPVVSYSGTQNTGKPENG